MEEPNVPVAKKFRNMVRAVFFMLRKDISKNKLMIDLNLIMKCGKIAGKALQNLMFHHSHNLVASAAASIHHRRSPDHRLPFDAPVNEYYEFSCSNSPAFPSFHLPFHLSKKNKHHSTSLFSCTHAPATAEDELTVQAEIKALEMMQNSEAPSPALPGFGRSPMVRQLRITDSPFPLNVEGDSHVDEAAEKFIERFYKDLRKQNAMEA